MLRTLELADAAGRQLLGTEGAHDLGLDAVPGEERGDGGGVDEDVLVSLAVTAP